MPKPTPEDALSAIRLHIGANRIFGDPSPSTHRIQPVCTPASPGPVDLPTRSASTSRPQLLIPASPNNPPFHGCITDPLYNRYLESSSPLNLYLARDYNTLNSNVIVQTPILCPGPPGFGRYREEDRERGGSHGHGRYYQGRRV